MSFVKNVNLSFPELSFSVSLCHPLASFVDVYSVNECLRVLFQEDMADSLY